MARTEPVEKSFYLFRRIPDIDRAQFSDYWLLEHAPLLLSLPEFVERRCDYVQNHTERSGPCGEEPFPYDGVTQVCVRQGASAMTPFTQTLAYRDRVIGDEFKFIDREQSIVFTTREHVVIPGQGACKVLMFPRKRPDLSLEQMNDYWGGHHRDVILAQEDFVAFLRGYRQNHRVAAPCKSMSGDLVSEADSPAGATEMWFDSQDAARAAFACAGFRDSVRADEANAFLTDHSEASFVRAHVILAE